MGHESLLPLRLLLLAAVVALLVWRLPTRRCPHCASRIRREAKICPRCHGDTVHKS